MKSSKTHVLKLDRADEEKEIEFELNFLSSLSRNERFEMMSRKTREILDILEKNGYRRSTKIIKRT